MKWSCLILSVLFASPVLAQSSVACQQALTERWTPPSTYTFGGYHVGRPIIPLLTDSGRDIYGAWQAAGINAKDGTLIWAKYVLIIVFQDEKVREHTAEQLMRKPPNVAASAASAAYLKYTVIHVGITGDLKNMPTTDCSGIQCDEEPFSVHFIDQADAYMPRQCVRIPEHPDSWKLKAWNDSGGYNGGPSPQSLLDSYSAGMFDHIPLTPSVDKAFLILLRRAYSEMQSK